MEKKDILLQLIQHYTHGNKAQFARMLGVPAQNISAWIARNSFDVDIVSTKCRDINPSWLLTGEGSMLLSKGKASGETSPTPPDLQKLDMCVNELLTSNSLLQQQYNDLGTRLAEVNAIISKSQEQLDRVISLFEKIIAVSSVPRSNTYSGMVAEEIKKL